MCEYIIQPSFVLCLVDGIVNSFYMGPAFCCWRQSLTLMGASLHPLLYMQEPFLNYIKNM